jgi:hypothetical protein
MGGFGTTSSFLPFLVGGDLQNQPKTQHRKFVVVSFLDLVFFQLSIRVLSLPFAFSICFSSADGGSYGCCRSWPLKLRWRWDGDHRSMAG